MALIQICKSYGVTGVPAGTALAAMRHGAIQRFSADKGGATLVESTQLDALLPNWASPPWASWKP